jgi:hypothetical protein
VQEKTIEAKKTWFKLLRSKRQHVSWHIPFGKQAKTAYRLIHRFPLQILTPAALLIAAVPKAILLRSLFIIERLT